MESVAWRTSHDCGRQLRGRGNNLGTKTERHMGNSASTYRTQGRNSRCVLGTKSRKVRSRVMLRIFYISSSIINKALPYPYSPCYMHHRDCNIIATASRDRTVRLWRLPSRLSPTKFEPHEMAILTHESIVWQIEWNVLGTTLASSIDGNLLSSLQKKSILICTTKLFTDTRIE